MKQIKDHELANVIIEDYMDGDVNEKRVIKKFLDKVLFDLGAASDAIALMEEEGKK